MIHAHMQLTETRNNQRIVSYRAIIYIYFSSEIIKLKLLFPFYCHQGRVVQWVRQLDYLSPIRRGFAPGFVNYKKGAFDSQPLEIKFTSYLPCHDRQFSPTTPASFKTKIGRHDIAEILLKVALSTKNQTKPIATIVFPT